MDDWLWLWYKCNEWIKRFFIQKSGSFILRLILLLVQELISYNWSRRSWFLKYIGKSSGLVCQDWWLQVSSDSGVKEHQAGNQRVVCQHLAGHCLIKLSDRHEESKNNEVGGSPYSMVHHEGSGCHSYGDDVAVKLTVSCEVLRRMNPFAREKLSYEFPQEDGLIFIIYRYNQSWTHLLEIWG